MAVVGIGSHSSEAIPEVGEVSQGSGSRSARLRASGLGPGKEQDQDLRLDTRSFSRPA